MPYEMEEFIKLIDPYLTAKLYRYHCIYVQILTSLEKLNFYEGFEQDR